MHAANLTTPNGFREQLLPSCSPPHVSRLRDELARIFWTVQIPRALSTDLSLCLARQVILEQDPSQSVRRELACLHQHLLFYVICQTEVRPLYLTIDPKASQPDIARYYIWEVTDRVWQAYIQFQSVKIFDGTREGNLPLCLPLICIAIITSLDTTPNCPENDAL